MEFSNTSERSKEVVRWGAAGSGVKVAWTGETTKDDVPAEMLCDVMRVRTDRVVHDDRTDSVSEDAIPVA